MRRSSWRRTLGQHLRHMTREQVLVSLMRISRRHTANGATIDQPEIRKLTGGYNGQSINFYVVRKLHEKLEALRNVPRVRLFDPTEQVD